MDPFNVTVLSGFAAIILYLGWDALRFLIRCWRNRHDARWEDID